MRMVFGWILLLGLLLSACNMPANTTQPTESTAIPNTTKSPKATPSSTSKPIDLAHHPLY